MQDHDLKKKILDLIRNYPVGSVATIRDGKPWVRYMAVQPQEDLSIYTTTCSLTRKVGQIKKDQSVHVAFGCDPKNWTMPFANVDGTAQILTDQASKNRFWKEEFRKYYKGPEDPEYVVIKITPKVIEYMAPGARQPEVYTI